MKRTFLLLTLLTCIKLSAQQGVPKLTGKIEISIEQGTLEGDLTLSDFPHINDYYIRINSGLNILHIKALEPEEFLIQYSRAFNDTTSTGESNAYYFKDGNGKGKFLPKSIQFKYVGKFPVVKDTIENYSRKDWKGNIAFNHNSVRADGFQSAWYPVLYDITNDKTYEHLTYDIEIICNDCSTLYANGSKPVKAQKQNFKSEFPQELTLFCGNYDFAELDNTYFLNSGMGEKEIETFGKLINDYKAFYAKKLNRPFDQPVSFIQTTPTSKKDGWMFVSYPTIFSIGWNNGLKNIVDPKYQKFWRPYIAHELGHYYFGTVKVFNSELGDMMSEGFAELLSLQLTKDIMGEELYKQKIDEKIEHLKKFSPKPFGKVKSETEYENRQLYVYDYAPLIFTAIKKEIGEEKMWKWLITILETETTFTNYDFLISTLQTTLNDNKLMELIEKQYLTNDNSLKNTIDKITME
ncbi:hypothetical protein [Salegentibacter sp. UBA1130]|uniref:hypothetical protein n=1 Tax=Salegentibacter sp. UBA1130 TaxID=1947451 RepID=UPI00257AFB7F|nr:hypothetical protein [Salegentibacter sp. UBA1130]